MTDQKTDSPVEQPKKRTPLETEIDDDLDLDPDDEFHGADEAVEAWENRPGKSTSSLSEEARLAEVFGTAAPLTAVADRPALASLPAEPMRGPIGEAPVHQWSVNVKDVFGPTGEETNQKPHQEHFKNFGVHINGRQLNLPGTESPTLRLGRNPLKTDLSFSDNYVSREHANITIVGDKTLITNLQESNKTTLLRDGVEIKVAQHPAATELLPGDTVRLGRHAEMQWLRAADMADVGKPRLYSPKPGQADPAAGEKARTASNEYMRNHEYSKPFVDGFQNIGGLNQIDESGKHNDSERHSIVVDQRPGADPALEQFVKEMNEKYSHLVGDPVAVAEELAKEAKTALEPKGWSSAAVDDGFTKMRKDHAGQRLLLGDFLEAAKYSKGAGVCNQQAMLLKVAFDNFYPPDMPNRPEMKMVRGHLGESPAGMPLNDVMNHAWNTLTIPNKDGSKGQETVFDPRLRIYGEAVAAHPDHHYGKDIPQMRMPDQVPKALDLKATPLTSAEVERLREQEVRYGTKGWKIKDIDGQLAQVSSYGSKNAEESHLAEANPDAAKSGKWVIGQEYNLRRSSGEIDSGWQLNGVIDQDGKKVFILGKQDALVRRVLLEDLQRQNGEVFEKVLKERAAQQKVAEVPAARPVNAESHGFVAGREVYHQGEQWTVQGQNGKDIEIARPASKTMSPAKFAELNGTDTAKVGHEYLVQRSTGEVERWRLTAINNDTGELKLRSQTGFKEKVSLERLSEQNRSVVGPLDVARVLADPNSKVHLITRWTDGDSGHDKWIGEVQGPHGEEIAVMVHKPPHGNQKDWLRLRNDLAAQELAKAMGAPELFPATVVRDGMLVQAFVGNQGESVASYLHNRTRQEAELRAQEPDLEKRIEKLLAKDAALSARVAEGIAFSVLLGDHDQHGMNFVINRDGAGPNDFHLARIDTDYAFSNDKTPNMDQRGNYGSIINGTFAHLSEQELPADVRAKIKTVSDQLATSAGREAFQKTTNLPMGKVEALAERARVMSDTGKFPRTTTMEEQRRELDMGSVRKARAVEAGDEIKAEQIGTVRSGPSDNLKQLVFQTHKLLSEVQAELAKGGQLTGQRLEKVRADLNNLMKLDPTLTPLLERYAEQLKPAVITGRTEQTTRDLTCADKTERSAATRAEIARLMQLPSKSAADSYELTRLRRTLFDEIKGDGDKSKELNRLYNKSDGGIQLDAKEKARLAELASGSSKVEIRLKENIDFTIDMLKADSTRNATIGGTKGGDATQGLILRMFEKQLQTPMSLFGGKTPAAMGYELIPLKSGGAMDDAGSDFVLANKRSGDFMLIDPTQEPKDSERKMRLPDLRKQGIISSDPYAERYGDKRDVGTLDYVARRTADINQQIHEILKLAKEGSPLNFADMIIPPTTRAGESTNKDSKAERLDKLNQLPSDQKAAEIRQWRTELLERQQGLNEMVPLAKEKAQKLRDQARGEADVDTRKRLNRQAELLEGWYQHTDGTSRVHRTGSPLKFIENTLRDLDASERSLPEKYKDASHPRNAAGQPIDIPKDLAQRLRDSAMQIQEMEALVSGTKKGSPQEVSAAADRLTSLYGLESSDVREILEQKTNAKYRQTLTALGDELTNTYLESEKLEKPKEGKNASVEFAMEWMLDLQEGNKTWSDHDLASFKKLTEAYKNGEPAAVAEVNKRVSAGIDAATGGTVRSAGPSPDRPETLVEAERKEFLKLMGARTIDVSALKDFALKAENSLMADVCIGKIVRANPENMVGILEEISSSKTPAAGQALLKLAEAVGSDKYEALLKTHWQSGHLSELLNSGKLTPEQLVKVIDRAGFDFGTKAIGELWDKSSTTASIKEQVAIALLKESKEIKGAFEISSITDEQRIAAVDFLKKQSSEKSAKTLLATANKEGFIGEEARKALRERWTSERQKVAGGESVSELVVGDRLKIYVEDLSRQRWTDGRDISTLQNEHTVAQSKLADARAILVARAAKSPGHTDVVNDRLGDKAYMENLLKDKPAVLGEYHQYLEQKAVADKVATEYNTIMQERLKTVENTVKKYCQELGIPAPKLTLLEPSARQITLGNYSAGNGEIGIHAGLLRDRSGPNPEFIDTLLHELGHLEQDTLAIRRLADELKIGKDATAKEIEALKKLHAERYQLDVFETETDSAFFETVLKERQGVPLTAGQAARADTMIDAFRQLSEHHIEQARLYIFADRMKEAVELLRKGAPNAAFIGGDDRMERAKKFLRTEELPIGLENAIKEWETATQSKAENRVELDKKIAKELAAECKILYEETAQKANKEYRRLAHEIETWDIGARAKFFAREALAAREAAASTAAGGSRTPEAVAEEPGARRPKRGPAPTLDKISGIDTVIAPDGTMSREATIGGHKALIGDEKTWKELLTKAEIEGMQQRRAELEKIEKEKSFTEDMRRELASLRDFETSLKDPAAHRSWIEKMGDRRPQGGFKPGEMFGRLSGIVILTSAVLGWYAQNESQRSAERLPNRAKLGGN